MWFRAAGARGGREVWGLFIGKAFGRDAGRETNDASAAPQLHTVFSGAHPRHIAACCPSLPPVLVVLMCRTGARSCSLPLRAAAALTLIALPGRLKARSGSWVDSSIGESWQLGRQINELAGWLAGWRAAKLVRAQHRHAPVHRCIGGSFVYPIPRYTYVPPLPHTHIHTLRWWNCSGMRSVDNQYDC